MWQPLTGPVLFPLVSIRRDLRHLKVCSCISKINTESLLNYLSQKVLREDVLHCGVHRLTHLPPLLHLVFPTIMTNFKSFSPIKPPFVFLWILNTAPVQTIPRGWDSSGGESPEILLGRSTNIQIDFHWQYISLSQILSPYMCGCCSHVFPQRQSKNDSSLLIHNIPFN